MIMDKSKSNSSKFECSNIPVRFDIDAGVISMEIDGKIIQQKILVDEQRELFMLEEPDGRPSVWSMPMNGKVIWSYGKKSIKWTRISEVRLSKFIYSGVADSQTG